MPEIKEVILTWPKVELLYHAVDRTGPYFGTIPEVEKGQYGYRLAVGQTLTHIGYAGGNTGHIGPYKNNATVEEIQKDGIVISFRRRTNEPELKPYKCYLSFLFEDTIWHDGRKEHIKCRLVITPCLKLYEKNKLSDILAGNIEAQDSGPYRPKRDNEPPNTGIWYKHGGWRAVGDKHTNENLKNFIKLGQSSLFF